MEDLFIEAIKDVCSVEKQILKARRGMVKKVDDATRKDALRPTVSSVVFKPVRTILCADNPTNER